MHPAAKRAKKHIDALRRRGLSGAALQDEIERYERAEHPLAVLVERA